MDNGGLKNLRSLLTTIDQPVMVRVVVDTHSGKVHHLDTIVAPPSAPEGWRPTVWRYKPVTFIAGEVTSRALAAALDPYDAQVLPIAGHELTLPVPSDQLQYEHKPSSARWDSMVLPWPTWTFALSQKIALQAFNMSGYLIGDDCPSFLTYQEAFRAFFYDEFGQVGHVPSDFAVVRVVLGSAWIARVLITPTTVQVHLGGVNTLGARVELNSPTWRVDARVTEPQLVTLPIPDGLPAGATLYLARDRDWLDFRAIGQYRQDELAAAGVEIEPPDDPAAEIQALISQGEGQQIEFKSQLPEDTLESKRTVFKTVAAFANGRGGNLVFGIEKDEATVCGLDANLDLITERDRLAQLARAIVTPAPEAEVQQYECDGKTLLVLTVKQGIDPPYGITLPGRKDKPIEFYVRRDATTFPATADEIRNAVLATVSQQTYVPPWGHGS